VLETEGWGALDDATREGFAEVLARLRAAGVAVLGRAEDPLIEMMEQAIEGARGVCAAITGWENRWAQRNLVDEHPEGMSGRAKATLAKAEAMTPDDYRRALLARESAQRVHAALAGHVDAAVTLSCPGPAPPWPGDAAGEPLAPRPTGDPVFNTPSSMLFAPVVSLPLMAVGGLPVGVQVMGPPHQDARVTALARWLQGAIAPVIAG
jgi:Asp-tRNA(Asn)/Glu-tRNA(Gln) amidotransferase A subunit family amidase